MTNPTNNLLLSLLSWDQAAVIRINQWVVFPSWRKIVRFISSTGDGYLYVAIAAVLYFYQYTELVLHLAIIFAFERPCYFILKRFLKRLRPCVRLQAVEGVVIPSDYYSFPSGHTSAAFSFVVCVGVALPVLLPVLLVWACCIGFSRVALGVHYPTDILAGACMGIGWSLLVLSFS